MMVVYSILAAVLPMLLYLFFIWRYDRFDREPAGLVLLNYFWGAIGAIILTLIISSFLNLAFSSFLTDKNIINFFGSIITAPFVEEITKGFFLILMVQNRKFDNITDGIVYGGAIGLGFGMTENFMYFVLKSGSMDSWFILVTVRTLFSAVMHCVATGTFGAFLGYAKFKKGISKFVFAILGLIIAMIIHSAWNTFVSFESTAWIGLLFMAANVLIFILLFTFSISGERKIIFTELMEESERGLIPSEHLGILVSSNRNKIGWVDESIRKIYISLAIRLAFRKMQLKNSLGINKNYYAAEVDNLRNSIAILLGKA